MPGLPLLLPALSLVGGGLLAAQIGLSRRSAGSSRARAFVALLAARGAGLLVLAGPGGEGLFFDGSLQAGGPFAAGSLLAIGGLFLALVFLRIEPLEETDRPECEGLLLLCAAAMTVLAASHDLLTLFVCLETVSLSSYVLAGFGRRDPRSVEAGVKYLLLGSFSTAFLLAGLAFLYGGAGSLRFDEVAAAFRADGADRLLLGTGAVLTAAGLLFKVGAFPFHMWVPDVYEGTPTPLAAFLAVAVKSASFIAFLKVASLASGPASTFGGAFGDLLGLAAVLTMAFGTAGALGQRSVKRLLAWSSVVHTGYLLIGLQPGMDRGLFFYLAAYTAMNAGAFGALLLVSRGAPEGEDLAAFRGLGFRRPGIALCLSLFLLALAGFPPTAGFTAKFVLFRDGLGAGHTAAVAAGIAASLVSLAYYLRVILEMYAPAAAGRASPAGGAAPAESAPPRVRSGEWILLLLAAAILAAGIWPDVFYEGLWALGR